MEHTENHIDELIGKCLSGEATQEERRVLDGWVAGSQANRRYYEQMKIVFEGAASIRQSQQFDTDAAWNKVKQNLRKPAAKEVAMRPARTPAVYWRVAASVVLVLSVGYAAYRWMQKPAAALRITSAEEVVQDTLPDGSLAFLNKQSEVAYQYDRGGRVRKVSLKGEAYFDVKHSEEETFVIEAGDVFIEDIGTAFNVKAYPDTSIVEVYVASGEVFFYTEKRAGLRLTAGETGVYDKRTRLFSRLDTSAANVLAYKTRVFTFENVSLGVIVASLNEVYDTTIRLGNTALASCRINVSFREESIDVIADIIAETLHLTATRTDHEIVLDGQACEY